MLKTVLCFLLSMLIIQISQAQIRFAGTSVYVKSEQHQPIDGFLWLKTGTLIRGEIGFVTKKIVTEPKPPPDRPNSTPVGKPTITYKIDGYKAKGQTYAPDEVFMYGAVKDRYVRDFLFYDKKGAIEPSKKDWENFHKGYIINARGEKAEGYVAIRTTGEDHLLFASSLDGKVSVYYQQPYEFHHPYNLQRAVQVIDGTEVIYVPTLNSYTAVDKIKKPKEGYIVLTDGTKKTGLIEFSYRDYDYKMNYDQLCIFQENGDVQKSESFSPRIGIDLERIVIDGKKGPEEYLSFDKGYFPKDKLINVLMKDSKDEEKNFHPGYIVFMDGSKQTGQIARARIKEKGFYFMDGSGDLRAHIGDKKVNYIAQTIDGKETKYKRVVDRYVTWHHADSKVSYVSNPYPTHVRKGLSNFVGGMASAVAEEVTDAVIEGSAKKAIYDGNADIMNTIETAVEMDAALDFSYNPSTDGGIYFEEYYILKDGKAKHLVYKKNMDSFVSSVLTGCDNFTTLDKGEINKLGNIGNLDETVVFLNEHGCLD